MRGLFGKDGVEASPDLQKFIRLEQVAALEAKVSALEEELAAIVADRDHCRKLLDDLLGTIEQSRKGEPK